MRFRWNRQTVSRYNNETDWLARDSGGVSRGRWPWRGCAHSRLVPSSGFQRQAIWCDLPFSLLAAALLLRSLETEAFARQQLRREDDLSGVFREVLNDVVNRFHS